MLVVESYAKELQCDQYAEVGMLGEVDIGKATTPQQGEQAIAAELLTRIMMHRLTLHDLDEVFLANIRQTWRKAPRCSWKVPVGHDGRQLRPRPTKVVYMCQRLTRFQQRESLPESASKTRSLPIFQGQTLSRQHRACKTLQNHRQQNLTTSVLQAIACNYSKHT